MKKELDRKLCEDFPLLYRDRRAPLTETCMGWGFQCGDGWEPLIRSLSGALEQLITSLPEDQQTFYRASQVKEKFGALRFGMCASTNEMEELIQIAEDESELICESCGGPGGRVNIKGWLRTSCTSCLEK